MSLSLSPLLPRSLSQTQNLWIVHPNFTGCLRCPGRAGVSCWNGTRVTHGTGAPDGALTDELMRAPARPLTIGDVARYGQGSRQRVLRGSQPGQRPAF
jgi:hypothetical protein